MKNTLLKSLIAAAIALVALSSAITADQYKTVTVKAPFPMEPIKEFIYPDRQFSIVDYGATAGGTVNNTTAIARTIDTCNKSGGGLVIVPAGEWLTGPIHFKSNVNLHLQKDAVLRFTDHISMQVYANTCWT